MKRAWERSSAQTVYDRTSFPARYWLGRAGALDGVGRADGFEHPDEIPSDVGLLATEAEARRTCLRVMLLMRVLTPRRQFDRAQPREIPAGCGCFQSVAVR